MSPKEISDLLGGNAVLLRIPIGQKRPVNAGWPKTTLETMEPFHSWNGDNIGVLLGLPSGALISIDWDENELAREFRALNPKLASTIISWAQRGGNFWIRLKGAYPKSCKIKNKEGKDVGEWRADGMQTVIDGVHPSGCRYKRAGEAPVEISFDEIIWPESVFCPGHVPPAPQGFSDADLQAQCGPPFWVDKDGNITKINQSYYSQRFCMENLVLFEQDEGSFFVYYEDNGEWRKVVVDFVKKRVVVEWERLAALFGRAQLHRKTSNGMFGALTDLVKAHSGRTKVFSPLKRIIHCNNGMLHLHEDGEAELRPFDPEYYSRNACPINWNPDAKAPRFQAILDSLDPPDADLILRYAANVLMGGNPSQQILILTGEGGTSKSTVCDLIELTAGRHNVAELRTEHLDNRFEIGRYAGKTLLSGKDVPADFLQKEGAQRIKALTGHDMLTGEIKREMGSPEVYGNFAIIITNNEGLTVKLEGDTDMSAWARRLMIVNFSDKSKHQEVITDYAKLLFAEEGEGILRMMVEAAFRHLYELETAGTFMQSQVQLDRVAALLDESRSIEHFVKACVFKMKGEDISSDELLTAYNEYCELRGWDPVVAGKFQKYVTNHMVRYHQSNVGTNITRPDNNGKPRRVRGYPNVSLAQASTSAADEFDWQNPTT